MQSTVAFDTKLPELKTFFVVSASRLLSFVVLSVSDLSFSFRGVNVFLSTVFWLPINTCLHFDVSDIQYGKMAKRKRKELTLQEKVDVIAYKDKNPAIGIREIAEKFQCGKTQIQSTLRDKRKLLDKFATNGNAASKRARMCRFQDIDSAMLEWFRSRNIRVSGPMLQAKAVAVAEQMQLENFKASNGWLEKFKTRHKIKGMTVSGESREVREETVESWKARLPQILAGYSPEDILNMDETGKFYRALPNKSLSEVAKQCRGGKQSKERVTCAFFVNAAGGKEKPIVIGKSANPRCFRGIRDLSTLSCTYFNQKKAWMDFGILDHLLTKFNRSCQRKGRHVLLLLDNAPCHPYDMKGKYSNIKVVFLPPNCTSKLQPLDLGIIQSFKLKYTKLMMTHVISQIEDCETAGDVCPLTYYRP